MYYNQDIVSVIVAQRTASDRHRYQYCSVTVVSLGTGPNKGLLLEKKTW